MSTLYEIDKDMLALSELLEEAGGDVTDPEVEEAIARWFAENEKNLLNKLDAYGAVIAERARLAEARKAEAARLSGLAKTDENVVTSLKERLKLFFKAHKIEKTESERWKWGVRANGGKPPLQLSEQVQADPLVLPSQYVEEIKTYKVLTDAIRATLENGTDEEKAKLEGLAKILPKGDHLRVW